MANAPFQIHSFSLYRRGGCFWGRVVLSQHISTPRPMRRLALGNLARHLVGKSRGAPRHRPRVRAAAVPGAVVLDPEVGRVLVGVRCHCSLCSLGAAWRWFACLLCAVLRFCLVYSCYKQGTPFGSCLCRPGATALPLGPGGIRWSLFVGGLGPVLSIPKLCFKPFRIFQREVNRCPARVRERVQVCTSHWALRSRSMPTEAGEGRAVRL